MLPTPLRHARAYTCAAVIIPLLLVLAACDGAGIGSAPSALTAEAVGSASLVAGPGGSVTALADGEGALLARAPAGEPLDLTFHPPTLAPGRSLAAHVEAAGGVLATLVSRPVADGRHAVSLEVAALRPTSVVVEARAHGRTVASTEAATVGDPARAALFDGGTALKSPSSVHYIWIEGPDGQWHLMVEYDYDRHGGTAVVLAGREGAVHADRLRFVLQGEGPAEAPHAVRLQGFEQLTLLPPAGESLRRSAAR